MVRASFIFIMLCFSYLVIALTIGSLIPGVSVIQATFVSIYRLGAAVVKYSLRISAISFLSEITILSLIV